MYKHSPITWSGSKRRLLKHIIPLLPKNIDNFYDLFCGSCSVAINVRAKNIIVNDQNSRLVEILNLIKNEENLLNKLLNFLDYFPMKENEENYNKLKDYYNKSVIKSPFVLFLLQNHSFSNLLRFNSKGEFNVVYGHRYFNENKQIIFKEFSEIIKDFKITNQDYSNFQEFKKDDFVYLDPPYLNTDTTYNTKWKEEDDQKLFEYLDNLNEKGIRFAMSNIISHNGIENKKLIEWSKKYNVEYIKFNYSNASYNKKDRSKESVEVLIYNYNLPSKNKLFNL